MQEFDLAALDTVTRSEQGVTMPVKQFGSDEPLIARNGTPVTITVFGPDSPAYRNAFREQMKRRMAEKASDFNPEKAEEATIDLLARCTISWTGVLDLEGNAIPCTPENVRKLFSKYPVIRAQVDAFVSDRANFLLASSEN